jgi:uncharacterized membrane protein YdjX (TVP38/TMEM64 family)
MTGTEQEQATSLRLSKNGIMGLSSLNRYVKVGIGLLLAGMLLWIYRTHDLSHYLNVGHMRASTDSFGPYGPLVFIGLCIAGVFLHLPEIVLIALGGLLFGTVNGFLYGWIGVIAGSTGTFLSVRYVLRDAFQTVLEGHFHRLRAFDERLAEHGFLTVLLLRLVLFMAPPLNWAIALTRVPFRHYIAGSALGVMPGIAITCYFADSIARHPTSESPFTGEMIIAGGLFAVFTIVSVLSVWRLSGKKPTPPSPGTR